MKVSGAVARILAAVLLTAAAGSAGAQQAYPNRPIRVIVPYPSGGAIDPLARLIGPKLTESWGQQVIVDNRPGGNTIIGTEAVAKSPPDGYTLMAMTTTHVTTPLLIPTPYDAIKDFAPVATLTDYEFILVLHPSVPANNLQQFMALAKSRPGQLNYGSSGTGSIGHLGIELFNILAGAKMQHIPYKGAGPALTDLIGGQLQLILSPPIVTIQHIKNGKLKAIAVTGLTRLSALPEVPPFAEAGLPGYNVKTWIGVVAPAGTPKEIIDKLSTEIARILALPDIMDKLDSQGMDRFISSPEQFAALMKADMAKYAKIIKGANIKVEN